MSAKLIDGKAAGAALRGRIAEAARGLHAEHALVPGLAVVLVGDDPASDVYVRSKTRATHEAGFHAVEHRLPATVSQLELAGLVDRLNRDPEIHGILVQLPLPAGLDSASIIRAIDPAKDVDGLTLGSVGALWSDERALTPCTPLGCLILLRSVLPSMSGLHAVILGRSGLVGKPMAALLLRENCTVTIVHSKTQNVPALCREADILVAAIGRPELLRGDWVKPGATVIDVGINRVPGEHGRSRLVGDVAFHEAIEVAGAITPVPGGVGPMTIACLMRNTLFAACWSAGLNPPEV